MAMVLPDWDTAAILMLLVAADLAAALAAADCAALVVAAVVAALTLFSLAPHAPESKLNCKTKRRSAL